MSKKTTYTTILFSLLITVLLVSCRGKLDTNAAGDLADATLPFVQSLPAASVPAGDVTPVANSQDSNSPSNLPPSPVIVPFDSATMEMIALTGAPAMLPPVFPADESLEALSPYFITRDVDIYVIDLGYGQGCNGAGACHSATVAVQKAQGEQPVGTISFPFDPASAKQTNLPFSITGYFVPSNCGASCSDGVIFWIYNGYEYMLGIKSGSMETLVSLATAAINNSLSN